MTVPLLVPEYYFVYSFKFQDLFNDIYYVQPDGMSCIISIIYIVLFFCIVFWKWSSYSRKIVYFMGVFRSSFCQWFFLVVSYCETTWENTPIYFLTHCHSDNELCRITFNYIFPNPVNIVGLVMFALNYWVHLHTRG